jgi:hypothetical protein
MLNNNITVIQINLQHCKLATSNLLKKLSNYKNFICLIQEPYLRKFNISGFPNWGNLYYHKSNNLGPRACIFTSKEIDAWQLSKFCNRDQTTIEISVMLNNINLKKISICSSYFPYDQPSPPPTIFQNFINSHKQRNVIIGSDTNAHHIGT